MIDVKDRLLDLLFQYDVQFCKGGNLIEKVGASANIEVLPEEKRAVGTQVAVDSAMQAAMTICLGSITGKIKLWLDPKIGQTVYIWTPDEWDWCHDPQFVWEPVRMAVQTNMYDRQLCMEVMAGVEKI